MNNIFLVQTIIITFIYLLTLSIVQTLKFLQQIQSYEDVQFLGTKWCISLNDNFFFFFFFFRKLLMSLVCFIHAYLHAKNQTRINLLVKY